MLPDIFTIPAYAYVGFISDRLFFVPNPSDWLGFRNLHPIWSLFWELPHSLIFLLVVIIPLVIFFRLPKMAIAAYFSHIFVDIFTHSGEWKVKPFYPLSYTISGFTNTWAYSLQQLILVWIALLLIIILAKIYFINTKSQKKNNKNFK